MRSPLSLDPSTGRIKQVLRYNQYGGTVGGPVVIPKLYNGRNRTFFFAGYEQWKWRATGSPRLGTVATQRERDGDFSNTRDGRGVLIPLFDPATTRANATGTGFVRDVLPGNLVQKSRMDPLSLRVLPYMPLPNATATDAFTNANNFVALVPSKLDQGTTTMRPPHQRQLNLLFRYTVTRNTRLDGWGLGSNPRRNGPARQSQHRGGYSRMIGRRFCRTSASRPPGIGCGSSIRVSIRVGRRSWARSRSLRRTSARQV